MKTSIVAGTASGIIDNRGVRKMVIAPGLLFTVMVNAAEKILIGRDSRWQGLITAYILSVDLGIQY